MFTKHFGKRMGIGAVAALALCIILALIALAIEGHQDRAVGGDGGTAPDASELGGAVAPAGVLEGSTAGAIILEAATIVSVVRPTWNTNRIEVTYSAPPTLGDLQSTLLRAPGTDYPILWLEHANITGNVAVGYCPWPADQPHWIVVEQGAVTVCGQFGEPAGQSPCTPAQVIVGSHTHTRPMNVADIGTLVMDWELATTGEVWIPVSGNDWSDSVMVAREILYPDGTLVTIHNRAVFRDCASDSLIMVYTPQAAAALREGCQ